MTLRQSDTTYNFFRLLNASLNPWNIPLGLIVQNVGFDLVFSNYLQVLLDRQLALPEALSRLSRRHFHLEK
jgi:hypothetical protein